MTNRIDLCLDGGLPPAGLTVEERAEVEAIRAAAEVLRASLPPVPAALEARVLQRIHALDPMPVTSSGTVLGRAGTWIRAAAAAAWQPRTLTVRPALAAALVLIALAFVLEARVVRPGGGLAQAEAPLVYVQFRLEADGASSVELAGSFTGWQPEHRLVESNPGIWTLVVGLPPGVHDYAFVVDDQHWVVDPAAATIDDGFGGQNSRIALLPS